VTPDGLKWRKSSRSTRPNNECVEVAVTEHDVFVRDSKNADGGRLKFGPLGWKNFLCAAKSGEYGPGQ
jgi:Domain of unknown function (DUF397)